MRLSFYALALALTAPAMLTDAAIAQRHDNGRHEGWDRGRDDDRGNGRWGRGRGPDDRGDWGWRGDRNDGRWDPQRSYRSGDYRERRLGRGDRIYRGGDGRYYCRRTDGTTGLVIGALAGGLLGNAIGGNTLGALLGAGGGAVLGRSIDRGNVRCR